jgi:5,10-methylene-tetrahydrofolate dehydrogenase/methenyl tetrahydrofolate cyclohydrolase
LLEKASQIFPVSNNFKDLFKILKISKPIKWDESHRFDQICFVNAIIAHVYGLNKKDFEYIMNQFPILKKQEEEKHGEFISLNKCLDYFSKLQIEK